MATSGALSTSNSYVKYKITIAQNFQNVANNTSNVTVSVRFYRTNTGYSTYGSGTVYCKINGTTRSKAVTPSQRITSSGIVLYTWTGDIAHAAGGTKTLTCSAWINLDTPLTSSEQSYSQTLTTIPRASSLSASNGTLGTAQTLTITRAASTFKHRIEYTCGSASGYAAGSGSTYTTATSISWAPPISLAGQNTTGTSVSIKLTLNTYTSGGTHIGSTTKTITAAIPASVKPSCSLVLDDVSGWDDTYGSPVQGLSKIKITVNPTLAHGSPIAAYSISANDAKYTTRTATTDLLKMAGESTVSATVKDKRGRSGTASYTMQVLAYSPPKVSVLTVHRCDSSGTDNDQGEYIRATFSAAVSPVDNKNTASYTLRYKKSATSIYTEIPFPTLANTYTVTNREYTFRADSNSSYDVEVEATDRHGTATRSTSASTAFTLLNWGPDGTSMGVGKVAEKPGTLDIALDVEVGKPIVLIDGGKIPLVPTAEFNVYGGNDSNCPWCRKTAAGVVEVSGAVSPASANNEMGTDTEVPLCTLPAGYRPARSFYNLQQGSGDGVWMAAVNPDGMVAASRYRRNGALTTPSTSAWLTFHLVFVADQ